MDVLSVEPQDRLLDLLPATACEVAIDADAPEPGLFENPQRRRVVRCRAGEEWSFGGHGQEALEGRTGDTPPRARPIDPEGHLGLVVDPEVADRPGGRPVGIDDLLHDARIVTQAGHVGDPGGRRTNPPPPRGRRTDAHQVCAKLDGVRRYLADTSALIVFSTVAGVFVELVVARLTVEQCLRARLTAVPIILVTGRPYGLYRDWVWRLARADGGDAARRLIADTTAFVSFQLPVYWAVLLIVDATFWQIAAASVTATIVLLVTGRPYGALLDVFRRLYRLPPQGPDHALD